MIRSRAVPTILAGLVALAANPVVGQDLRDVATTPNQLATATALEEFYADATFCDCELSQSVRYLRSASPEEARRGLEALSGQDLAGALSSRASLSNLFTQRLTWQLRPAGPEPPRQVIDYVDSPTGGTGLATGVPCDPACGVRRAYLADPRAVTWIQGVGGVTDETSGPGAYDSELGGLLFGGHLPVTDDVSLGLSANYGHIDADATRTNLDVETLRFLGYGRYAGEAAYAFGGLGYGFDDYSHRRRTAVGVLDRTATGDASGDEAFAFAEAGLTLPVSGALAFQPFIGLTGSHLARDGFTERSDGDLELVVTGADRSTFATTFGGRVVMQRYLAPDLLLRPELRAAWWHDYLADDTSTTVAFVRDPNVPFTVAADGPSSDAALLGAGATLVTWGQCSFGIQYDAALATDAVLHAVALTALCTW